MARVSTVALSQDELKKQAAHRACEYVKSGMVLGLGTGSTTAFAVDRIGELLKSGELKDIIGVPTSIKTYEQAAGTHTCRRCRRSCNRTTACLCCGNKGLGLPVPYYATAMTAALGIPLATLDEQQKIDLAIDGADEVDPKLNVVKGRGGALLREKVSLPSCDNALQTGML